MSQSQAEAYLWADENPEAFSLAVQVGGAEARIARKILYRNEPNLDSLLREAAFVAYRAALGSAWAAWLLEREAMMAAMWLSELHPRYRPGITKGH
jgi:hypothetical protein